MGTRLTLTELPAPPAADFPKVLPADVAAETMADREAIAARATELWHYDIRRGVHGYKAQYIKMATDERSDAKKKKDYDRASKK